MQLTETPVKEKTGLLGYLMSTREATEIICKPLETEDYSVQPIIEVSPPKWHLAHTTWFFEQFVLVPHMIGYKVYNDDFAYLFNSYYNNAGDRILRPNRGLMTRPTVNEVIQYRHYVTDHLKKLIQHDVSDNVKYLIEVGTNHEQQHQELLAYDIKYILGNQPTFPHYNNQFTLHPKNSDFDYISIDEGVYTIGYQGDGFHFDNEKGVHKVYLHDFIISNRLVTNGEYIEFIKDGGYSNFNLWHSEGWDWVNKNDVKSPMYWHLVNDQWHSYTLNGLEKVDPMLPVMHINYYEAFAFAEWSGKRLPTEFEWEVASSQFSWGDLWEWTGSAYLPYPGFSKVPGALGEYNGKFMVNQHVLRGRSIATPEGHSRHTYRNFFHPQLRWMFCGVRLVK